jgi:TetR/AcrR family transcriptional regulator, transcriptional repressor for nem operon
MSREARQSRSRARRSAPEATPSGAAAGSTSGLALGRKTRGRILETAFQLFHEQGYHATGVATILREAGVNAGSLYHFFPSKEALLVGVLEYALGALRPAVMDPAECRSKDPIKRVFELLRQYREGMHAWGCKMGCPIGNLALEVADDNAAARRLIHQNFENWVVAVKKWLDDAGDRLPQELDRAQLARFVLTVMEGGIMQARAAGKLAPFDDSVAQLRFYFDALQKVAAGERTTAVGIPQSTASNLKPGGRSAPGGPKQRRAHAPAGRAISRRPVN